MSQNPLNQFNQNIRADLAYIETTKDSVEELPEAVTKEDLRKIDRFKDCTDEELLHVLHFIRQFAVLLHEDFLTKIPKPEEDL